MYERDREEPEWKSMARFCGIGVTALIVFYAGLLSIVDSCDAREDEREARICRQGCSPSAIRSQNDGDCVCEHGQTPAININTGTQ